MGRHHAPEPQPLRDRAAVRTTALALLALVLVVVAMIASYSGAFAKPTLHDLDVAVAARQQVHQRHTDAGFVVDPTGAMTIYVAGGGGRSVATAAETVGQAVAAKAGLRPTIEDIAPASAGDPSGTVEFYAVIFISIGA